MLERYYILFAPVLQHKPCFTLCLHLVWVSLKHHDAVFVSVRVSRVENCWTRQGKTLFELPAILLKTVNKAERSECSNYGGSLKWFFKVAFTCSAGSKICLENEHCNFSLFSEIAYRNSVLNESCVSGSASRCHLECRNPAGISLFYQH